MYLNLVGRCLNLPTPAYNIQMALIFFKELTQSYWTPMILLSSTLLILSAIVYTRELASLNETDESNKTTYESNYDPYLGSYMDELD